MTDPCQFLPWDSNFFDLRIARVNGNQLSDDFIKVIVGWCEQNQIDCLYFLANPQDIHTVKLAEDHHFHLVDIRVTQAWNNPEASIDQGIPRYVSIRPYVSQDLPDIRKIASKIFVLTRFYSDPCFPRERVERFYDTWIKNSCEGYADQVLIAQVDHLPVGFITCHNKPNLKEGEIGLIGVSEGSRGQGIGKSLVNAALRWFIEHGSQKVTIVTQGTNIPGLTVCQRVGFCTSSVQLWYHKWFKPCGTDIIL
jgi:dTDP-4-amino-4,6-dideoxy-D-galactose acyltransferase